MTRDPLPAWFDDLDGPDLEARILAEFGETLDTARPST